MDIVIIISIGLILNISGAILTKYLTLNLSNIYISVFLLASLMLALFLRVIYWVIIGKKYQLSYIYPLLSLNYFLSFISGIVLFNELYTNYKLIGSLLIITGVVIVSYSNSKYDDVVL